MRISYQQRYGNRLQANISWGYFELSPEGKKKYRNLRYGTGIIGGVEALGDNVQVASFSKIAEDCFNFLKFKSEVVTPEALKEALDQKLDRVEQKSELTYLAPFIRQEMTRGKIDSTTRNYRSLAYHVEVYEKYRGKRLTSESISYELYIDFLEFWKEHRIQKTLDGKRYPEPFVRRANTVWSLAKGMKATLSALANTYPSIWRPQALPRGKGAAYVQESFPVLTTDHINILISHQPSSNCLNQVKFGLLTLLLTGARFSDLYKTYDNLVELETCWVSEYTQTKKTNTAKPTEVCIPIHPVLLDMYRDNGRGPRSISNQKFNNYCKELLREAGITELFTVVKTDSLGKRLELTEPLCDLVSSHTGRRSFVTNMVSAHVPLEMISAITGHSTKKSAFGMLLSYSHQDARVLAEKFFDFLLVTFSGDAKL